MSAASFQSHWFGRFLQESFQVNAIEKSVTIRRIAVHWNRTYSCPFPQRILREAEYLRCLGGFHIVRQSVHSTPPFTQIR
jgi:hypothetical protein